MVIDSEDAFSMQLQFNNSPLEGRGGIKPWKGETRFSSFFLLLLLFLVFYAALSWDGEKDWKKRDGLFSTFCFPAHTRLVQWDAAGAVIDWMPLTEWTLSQAALSAQAAGCVYSCVVPAKWRHQHRRGRQQQQHEGLTSSSNPHKILSGRLNKNNGISSSTLTACRPRKIARVVTHDYCSWVPWTVTIMTHSMRTNEGLICHIMWSLATANKILNVSSLCVLL